MSHTKPKPNQLSRLIKRLAAMIAGLLVLGYIGLHLYGVFVFITKL